MSTSASPAPMTVAFDGGQRFIATIRQHQVVVDQPERGGGADSAPMPLELLGAALGTCVALYAQRYLASRALPLEGLRVEVEQHAAANPHRIGTFAVRVQLPAGLSDEHRALLDRVVRACPVHHTLTHGAAIEVDVT